jgi:hypothetical protein
MEDYMVVTPAADGDCFFAFFDDHRGYQAVEYANQNL